jgi:hypothetical protein
MAKSEFSGNISFGEYVINTTSFSYHAVWDCQVEWTEECIYYDAETGKLYFEDGELLFSCLHKLKVSKHDYLEHMAKARALPSVTNEDLLRLIVK